MYILIISNDKHCRALLIRNLLIRGHLAVGFASLNEGSRLIKQVKPRCIIVCETPSLTDRYVRQIRTTPDLEHQPVIAISDEQPSARWINEWGINRYLVNPFTIPELLETLSPWLNVSETNPA